MRKILKQAADNKKVKEIIRFLYHGGVIAGKKAAPFFGDNLLEEIS
ncbi:hypothetical protein [Carboxydocella sp. ULO1]|nr:hypothetical protein [Carboxydocella sp. ULO1]